MEILVTDLRLDPQALHPDPAWRTLDSLTLVELSVQLRDRRLDIARTPGADVAVLDLEDSVPPPL